MKTNLFVILFYCFVRQSLGQTWEWARKDSSGGVDEGTTLSGIDSAGNIYLTGNHHYFSCSSCPNYWIPFLSKFDSDGNLLWKDTIPFYGNSATDIAGNTYVFSGNRLGRYDSNGNLLWDVTNSPVLGYSAIALFPKGGVILCGVSYNHVLNGGAWNSQTTDTSKTVYTRIDTNGNLLWNTVFNDRGAGGGYNILATDQHGFVYSTAGRDFNALGTNNGLIIKLDSVGEIVSSFPVPSAAGSSKSGTLGFAVDKKNCIYLLVPQCAANVNGIEYPENVNNAYLIKYDQSGNVLWFKEFHGDDLWSFFYLTTDPDDNVFLTFKYNWTQVDYFSSSLPSSYSALVVAKLDSYGNLLWYTKTEVVPTTYPGGVLPMSIYATNENLYITGSFSRSHSFGSIALSTNEYRDLFLVKIKNGNEIFQNPLTTNSGILAPNNDFLVSPNPTTRQISIQYDCITATTNLTCSIRNLLGQEIYSESFYSVSGVFAKSLDLCGYPKGMYLVEIRSEKSTEIRKVILE